MCVCVWCGGLALLKSQMSDVIRPPHASEEGPVHRHDPGAISGVETDGKAGVFSGWPSDQGSKS